MSFKSSGNPLLRIHNGKSDYRQIKNQNMKRRGKWQSIQNARNAKMTSTEKTFMHVVPVVVFNAKNVMTMADARNAVRAR